MKCTHQATDGIARIKGQTGAIAFGCVKNEFDFVWKLVGTTGFANVSCITAVFFISMDSLTSFKVKM